MGLLSMAGRRAHRRRRMFFILSHQGNDNVHGRMITTNDDRLADYAVSLRHHGVGSGLTQLVNLGNDWLMNEVTALLGIYQLRALETNLKQRNEIARRYAAALADSELIQLFRVLPISGIATTSTLSFCPRLSIGENLQKL